MGAGEHISLRIQEEAILSSAEGHLLPCLCFSILSVGKGVKLEKNKVKEDRHSAYQRTALCGV